MLVAIHHHSCFEPLTLLVDLPDVQHSAPFKLHAPHVESDCVESLVCRGIDISCQTKGVAVTLIDFTLSRLEPAPGQIAFSDLSTDPELFQGPKGDPQVEYANHLAIATSDLQIIPPGMPVCGTVSELNESWLSCVILAPL